MSITNRTCCRCKHFSARKKCKQCDFEPSKRCNSKVEPTTTFCKTIKCEHYKEKNESIVTIRIPTNLKNDFSTLCKSNNQTMSTSIRKLIEEDLNVK